MKAVALWTSDSQIFKQELTVRGARLKAWCQCEKPRCAPHLQGTFLANLARPELIWEQALPPAGAHSAPILLPHPYSHCAVHIAGHIPSSLPSPGRGCAMQVGAAQR